MQSPLALTARLDRTAVPARVVSEACLAIEVGAHDTSSTPERPPFVVVFLIDASGSMKGPPLANVIVSVERLASMLMPRDAFGVVAFANDAAEIVELRSADAAALDDARRSLSRLEAGGQTNMAAGLKAATKMLGASRPGARELVFLLSDGVPNIGLCTPLTLAELVRPLRPRISLWSLGYGPHHQEDILAAASDAGGGRYQYIPQPEMCEFSFAKALGAQADVVGEAVELRLVPHAGVEVRRVLGKYEQRYGAEGLVLRLPDVFVQTRRRVVAELQLGPWNERASFPAVDVLLTCRLAGSHKRYTVRTCVDVTISDQEGTLIADAREGVMLARCDEVRRESRSLADRGQYEGATAVLRSMREAIEREPWFDPISRPELADAIEVLRDEANALSLRPTMETYRTFRRSQMSIELSGESFSASDHRMENAYGQQLVHAVAGEYPAARLEQLGGVEGGRTVDLRGEQTIGRGRYCDVVVDHDAASRAHAQVVAQGGAFYVVDLGSATGTYLNAVRVESHKLASDDVITVGDVRFRYIERDADVDDRMCAITADGDVYVLEKDRLFVVGRSRACSLVIKDMGIGPRHAYVEFRDDRWHMGAYDTPAGVSLRGQPVTQVTIRHGDIFHFGVVPLRFEVRSAQASRATVQPARTSPT